MALVSFPTPQYSSRLISSSQKRGYVLRNFHSPTSNQPRVYSCLSSRHRRLAALVPLDAKNSGSGEEDHRALETVLKLYEAIKNKNIHDLSDVIGDECRCICNFFSFFQPFQGKIVRTTHQAFVVFFFFPIYAGDVHD